MRYQIRNAKVQFGADTILNSVNFEIHDTEKIAIVGRNGCGKTTLLRLIAGDIEMSNLDSDESCGITMSGKQNIGFLRQINFTDGDVPVKEELEKAFSEVFACEARKKEIEKLLAETEDHKKLLAEYDFLERRIESLHGYSWKKDMETMFQKFGFALEDLEKPIGEFSGGQQTKIALIQLLLQRPDILLLDEPTNHLDIASKEILEDALNSYNGTVLYVSHDRYFLDKVVDKVIEIERGTSQVFNGNYSAYAEKKKAQRDAQMKLYMNQQQEIHHQEEVIAKLKSFNREKSIKRAESREKMLDKVQRIDKPQEIQNQMRISLEPRFVSGNDVLTVESLSKSFPGQTLFSDISFEIKRGERVALIGNNGTGKTTMLKIINGLIDADSGRFTLGSKVQIGYYDQEHHVLHMEKTIFEEISDAYPTLTETEIRNMLAAFLFTGDDVFKLISALSGGERGRVSLAKLMLSEANFLILDEPTNHLDIESIQWLENFIATRANAVILVSHDRAFIDNTTFRTLEIELGNIYDYKVKYSEYVVLRRERREQQLRAYENQQKKLADTEAFIERFRYKATKSVQVQSRIKQLEKVERIEVDDVDTAMLRLKFPPAPRSGSYPVICEEVAKRYGDHLIFDHVTLTINRGDKVAFVGKNGEGKSTLVKCIMGEIADFTGKLQLGHNVKIGYFAQNQAQLLNENLTVFDTIDYVAQGDIRLKIRDILGAFMFGGEASDKKVKVLSGGERTRLAMIRLLLEPVNLLILDEPTNHLDMRSKDVLKDALREFDGTVIVVSHDREFLDGLVDKVYEFGNQKVVEHLGGIYNFLEHKKMDSLRELERSTGTSTSMSGTGEAQVSHNKLSYEARKELSKVIKKAEKAVAEAEARISELENGIAVIEAKLATPEGASDASLYGEYSALKKELSDAMDLWTERTMELEELNTQDS